MVSAINADKRLKSGENMRNRFKHRLRKGFKGRKEERVYMDKPKIAIVGSPNVGKSVLFNALTKKYVTVSNYPGTTVEVTRGIAKIGDLEYEIIDTPGMYSLLPITEEEKVARRILINQKPNIIIHVVDAKNLERMLPFTLGLIETGLPIILALNIMDEAEEMGIRINIKSLEAELGISVVSTVSTTGRGMDVLKQKIIEYDKTKN